MRFFMELYNAPIERVCVENPVGYPWQAFRRPDQIVNPFDFGDAFRKKTCLWLRGLPRLIVESNLFDSVSTTKLPAPEPEFIEANGQRRYWCDSLSPKNRARERSRTFPGIAKAMAEQWD